MKYSVLPISLLLSVAILVLNVGIAYAAVSTFYVTARVVSPNSGGSGTGTGTSSVTGSWSLQVTSVTPKLSWAHIAVWTPACFSGTPLSGFTFANAKVGQTFSTGSLNAGTYCIELTDGTKTGASVTMLVTYPV